jgi:two-component system, NtrC family, sensor kinase
VTSIYRILLVEDSGTQALRLQYLFAEQGWQTERVSTSEEAVAKFDQIAPDLIIADHYWPGLEALGSTGAGLSRPRQGNAPVWNPPVLIFTAADLPDLPGVQVPAWGDAQLSKSVEDSVLLARVRSLLRKSETSRMLAGLARSGPRQARLLAVDDSPSYLEYLVYELSNEGHIVEAAVDGPEALAKIRVGDYDCILLDLVMPKMDGMELSRAISAMHSDLPRHPLVLMLTAHENPGEMARGLESGADDFVGKSSDIIVLKSRVRALLRRKLFQDALKEKEMEILRVNAAREAAELKAALVSQISEQNRVLEETNRKLKATQMHLVHSANMASLGQLVAGIAHEINNPIAFVDNNCYLINEKLENLANTGDAFWSPAQRKLIQSGRERLAETRIGLERVKELVEKLRTFSRLDEGEFKTIDVHESIDSVLLLLKHRKRQIEVEKQFGSDALLDCAPGQLNQVLMNVLANAMDAIDDNQGKITIHTFVQSNWYCISIRDSGPGIPVSIQSRLFEPFFTTKPVGKGTGLGLAISHSIIQAHKGQIEIASPEGGGAEFRIRIPRDLSKAGVNAINVN